MTLTDKIGGFIVSCMLFIILASIPICFCCGIYSGYKKEQEKQQHKAYIQQNHPFKFKIGDLVYHKTFSNSPFIIIDYNWNYENTYDNIYTCRIVLPPKIIEKSQNGQLFGSADSVDKSAISITENFYESELKK